MLRRTKIVATLGPATDDPKVLDEVIAAGVDVVRLNMSHGDHDFHKSPSPLSHKFHEKYAVPPHALYHDQ